MRKLLIIIILLLFTFPAFTADENLALAGTASGSGTNTVGTDTNINDDDTGTYFGGTLGGMESDGTWNYTDVITLDGTYDINKIEIYHNYTCDYAAGSTAELEYWIDVYYNSTWYNVLHQSVTAYGVDTTTTDSDETGWGGVTKVRVRADGSFESQPGGTSSGSSHKTYELRAWGVAYTDIGLRFYNGTSVIKIGVQDLDGHKLRVRKGGTTYGIPLLATDDSNASPIRIYDGSAVKSLPEVD